MDEEPQVDPTLDGTHPSGGIGEDTRSFDAVMEELASLSARHVELVAEAKASCSRSQHEEVSSLQVQLASVQAELASSKAEQLSSKAKLERAEASA